MNLGHQKINIYYAISIVLLIFSIFIFFNTKINVYFSQFSRSSNREVLSKIETTQLNSQMKLTLVKVKQNQKMYLEVFVHMNHGLELIETLTLDGEFDAFLMLKERTSNLLISNIDREPDLEIIAPTYDRRMKPILNVFKYDSNLEEFRRVNSKFSKPIL